VLKFRRQSLSKAVSKRVSPSVNSLARINLSGIAILDLDSRVVFAPRSEFPLALGGCRPLKQGSARGV